MHYGNVNWGMVEELVEGVARDGVKPQVHPHLLVVKKMITPILLSLTKSNLVLAPEE